MAVAIEHEKPGEFVVHASGDVTMEECLQARMDLLATPGFDRTARLLVDGRDVKTAPNSSELRAIAKEMRAVRDRGIANMAIVAGNDFVYGVARMFAIFALAVDLHVRAFRDETEARRWLLE